MVPTWVSYRETLLIERKNQNWIVIDVVKERRTLLKVLSVLLENLFKDFLTSSPFNIFLHPLFWVYG